MSTLTPPAHAHVYILEKSQHKVPEEALKVSNTDSRVEWASFRLGRNTCSGSLSLMLKPPRSSIIVT